MQANASAGEAGDGLGVYRRGDAVIIRKGGRLPPFCIKCGEPEWGSPVQRSLYISAVPNWFGALALLLIPLGLIPFIVIFAIWRAAREEAQLSIPLCAKHRDIYQMERVVGWTWSLGGPLVLIVLIALRDPPGLILAALALICLGNSLLQIRLVRAVAIEPGFTAVKGAGGSFLARLPEEV